MPRRVAERRKRRAEQKQSRPSYHDKSAAHSGVQAKQAAPEWHLKMPPEEYLEKHPDGPNADLARQVIAARGG